MNDKTRDGLYDKAQHIMSGDISLQNLAPFGARVTPGLSSGPRLFIEDHNWIRLFEHRGDNAYSYRALLLASEGDQVVIGVQRCKAFEHYCRQKLKLGRAGILVPSETERFTPLTNRCIQDEGFLSDVVGRARQHAQLSIIPYMGIEAVWHLASLVAERSGVPVRVAAPFPHLTRCTNDKAWFSRCVENVLGVEAVPETLLVDSFAVLTRQLARLAGYCTHVAVKLVNSASSAGNFVFDAKSITRLPPKKLREMLIGRLKQNGWAGDFPLLLTAWESPVASTPSVHLWIPSAEDGDPVVKGIFEQSVTGENAEFNGASPARLKQRNLQRLAGEAMKLALVFQWLGYFGQCSFDAILTGENEDSSLLHWVECNGRWGGVSIPLALAERLEIDCTQQGLVVVEEAHLQGRGCALEQVLRVIENELYIHHQRPHGVIILSPGRLQDGSGYEIMVVDKTQALARRRAARVSRKLTAYLLNRQIL